MRLYPNILVCLQVSLLRCWGADVEIPKIYGYECCTGSPTILPMVEGGTSRYQQVFDASMFTKTGDGLPPEGAFLTTLLYRAACDSLRGWFLTNLQINASTTLRKPDQLSSRFSDNLGLDDTRIFGPSNTIFETARTACVTADHSINAYGDRGLSVSFLYVPSKGNLLLDFRNNGSLYSSFPMGPRPSAGRLDGSSNLIDGVSRAFAPSVDAEIAELVDTGGFAVGFYFSPIPKLRATIQTNTVELRWPTIPKEFRLQIASSATGVVRWTDVTTAPVQDFGFWTLTIPITKNTKSPRYYRLFWDTPQPIVSLPSLNSTAANSSPP